MTVRAQVSSDAAIRVEAFLQVRATGQSLSDALDNGRKIPLGSISVDPHESTQLDLDFASPRTRARSIRVLLNVSSTETDAEARIDEFELIEWKTPFHAGDLECLQAHLAR